jgi:hypothetical protein
LRAYQRTATARRADDRMKLHRHVVACGGSHHTVITLRPGAYARFSDNYYHGTWHVLSDWHGARVLGRLLWGLAYQRVPGTLVLIDRPQLDPNPFSGEPADPIALVPSQLTSLSGQAARELRARLPLTRPTGTVRWQTHGLDLAIAARDSRAWRRGRPGDSSITRSGGLITLAGTPDVLRDWAVAVYQRGEYCSPEGMDYLYLGDGSRWMDGELQIFRDYRRRVSAATQARREVLATIPRQLPPSNVEPLIWQRAAAIRRGNRNGQSRAVA